MGEKDPARGRESAEAEETAHEETTDVDWGRPETWPKESGGVKGPEPTRYGDWERNGRCSDF